MAAAANTGDGGVNALTIRSDHSVGAGQFLPAHKSWCLRSGTELRARNGLRPSADGMAKHRGYPDEASAM